MKILLAFVFLTTLHNLNVQAKEFNITEHGAVPNDAGDDSTAIEKAIDACKQAGGGTVLIPAGTFILSRRNNESPILELPSNTTLRGEGPASILKFDPKVNQSNFWRMIGAPVDGGTKNVVIRDLHLDGSNTHPKYIKGETHEHNSGIWFYNKKHVIENIKVFNVFAENFSGDCMAFSYNCRAITVRDCTLRNFIRQGIQMGGSPGSRDYLVTGCRDLEHSVKPGGSTIHVEHARGLKNVIIENNQCRQSILAGGVDGMIIRGNIVQGTADNPIGVYVWGNSRYNSQPGENVTISDNQITAAKTAILLNGTKNVKINGNTLQAPQKIQQKRTEGLQSNVTE